MAALSILLCACGDDSNAGNGGNAPTGASTSATTNATSSVSSASPTSSTTGTTSGAGGESPGPERAPGMTDLSILFPRPASAAENDLLIAPDDVGANGEILPLAIYDALPALLEEFPGNTKADQLPTLRVVAARLDPCFASITGEGACRRQVRLVMQPGTDDAAFHLFFELEDAAFTGLVGDVTRAQTAADAAGPLGVHPTMAREGLSGPAAQAIRDAILKRVGAGNLSRVTFMTVSGKGNTWAFGGLEIDGATTTPISIVGSGFEEQRMSNNTIAGEQDFNGEVFPVIPPDDLTPFYRSDDARTLTDDELWPTYESALRIRNPGSHTSESVSCVACHTADAAIAWADRNTGLAARPSPLRFESTHDLTPPSDVYAEATKTVRAFGYVTNTPAVSARTIAETAVLVDRVAALYGF